MTTDPRPLIDVQIIMTHPDGVVTTLHAPRALDITIEPEDERDPPPGVYLARSRPPRRIAVSFEPLSDGDTQYTIAVQRP